MPRTAREIIEGYPHHVILRGNNRRRLFSYTQDFLLMRGFIARAVRSFPVELHGLVLMANHVHMLLTPLETDAMGACVKQLAQRYATRRNRSRGGSGKLFEERYYSKPIRTDSHYTATLPYIELNSVRAGLCAHPRDYRWSTYHLHAADGSPTWAAEMSDLWTPSQCYLDVSPDPRRRQEAYAEWIADVIADERRPEHWKAIAHRERPPAGPTPLRPDGTRAH